MNRQLILLELTASGGDIAKHFEAVVNAFFDIEHADPRILDSSFGFTMLRTHADLEVQLTVLGDSLEDAFVHAQAAVRTAIHAAGGGTVGWDDGLPDPDQPRYSVINGRSGDLSPC
jgi:hypothetical protein